MTRYSSAGAIALFVAAITTLTSTTVRTQFGDPSLEFTQIIRGGIPSDLAVTEKGWVYLVGTSRMSDYPVTANAYDSTCGTDGRCNPFQGRFGTQLLADHVLTVFDPSGHVHYSTYLGGSGEEGSIHIAIARDGEVWLSGATTSTNFEHQPAGASCAGSSGTAVWIARFDVSLRRLQEFQCVVRSASLADLVVDENGNAWLLGATGAETLPVRNAWQPRHGGQVDMFVAEVTRGTLPPRMATYIGGNGLDSPGALAVSRDAVAVTGNTLSTNFPLVRAMQNTFAGPFPRRDMVLVSLDRAGQRAEFSTYFGTAGDDSGQAVTFDAGGNIYVAAQTTSADLPISPTAFDRTCGSDGRCNATSDVYVAKFTASGGLLNTTYLGGSGADGSRAIMFTPGGSVLVTGATQSADFPLVRSLPVRWTPAVNFETAFLSFLDSNLQSLTRSLLVADGEYVALQLIARARDFTYVAGQTTVDNAPGIQLRKLWCVAP